MDNGGHFKFPFIKYLFTLMKDFLESYFLCIRGSFHNRRQLLRIKWKEMIFALKFIILIRATRKQYIHLSISTTPY